MFDINKLNNVSKGKQCKQSSLSKWSKEYEANRLVDTTLNVDFAIHTDKEENPWWMVDLEDVFKIEKIIIHNRKHQKQDKARTLKVEISIDGQRWKVIQQGFQYWGNRKDIVLKQKLKARYVKISLEENTYLHLSNMGVYTRDYFIVAGRNDGLGGRLQTMLNALYISKHSELKFAYSWRTNVNEYAKDFLKDQKIGENIIIGHAIEKEEELFTKEFINKYSCTDSVNANQGILRSKKLKKLSDIIEEPLEREWGWYAPLDNLSKLFSELDEEAYHSSISQLWNEIGFRKNIKLLINDANHLAINFSSNFVAIHIRSGDIVYGGYRLYGKRFTKKALPLHLAIGAIEDAIKRNKKIILFGDDNSSNNMIRNIYNNQVKLVEDFFPNAELSNLERAIFEITFMSNAKQILASGASFFSSLAAFIGNIGEVKSLYKTINKNQQYNIYTKYINQYKFHPYQMAFSYFHFFMLASELNKPLQELESHIKKGMQFDSFNNKYLIFTMDILLQQNKIVEAEELIYKRLELEQNIKEKDYQSLKETLILKADKKYWHSFVFQRLLNYQDNEKFPCLSYLSYVIRDDENNISIASTLLQGILND